MASLHALATRSLEAAAFIEIGRVNHASGYDFSREQLGTLEGAKLFVSSADDTYGAADAAREWHDWARKPKQLAILPGNATEPTCWSMVSRPPSRSWGSC
jgi:hypothetical protein